MFTANDMIFRQNYPSKAANRCDVLTGNFFVGDIYRVD